MPVKTDAIGKSFPPFTYEVGREKIAEYARAVGIENPVHFDRHAAREAGFRDVAAPPMFAVVYSTGAVAPALFDPEVGMDFAAMVHGGQEFVWSEPVVSGDEITTWPACRTSPRTVARASTCSSRCPPTRRARRSCAAPGPTSCAAYEPR